ncbi:MAG: hypothetical protein K2W95_02745 [Candidatus Obscuribacterales bacterium]|nr:hypothetical protein [Candidatus Obscuribacterales bacterium]
MRKHLHLLMGIDEDASPREMKLQYQRLMAALFALDANNPKYEDRLSKARERLSVAYESTKKIDSKRDTGVCTSSEQPTSAVPKIGELLIEAGIIDNNQLEAALEVQRSSKQPIPIGRLFVHWNLITWDELAFYLRIQDLLKLDPTAKERFTRQLLDLGLISAEELEIVQLDCETVGCSLEHAICRRGWLKPELLKELTTATQNKCAAQPKVTARVVPHTPRLNSQNLRSAAPC